MTNYIFQTWQHPTHYPTKWPWYSPHEKVGSVFPTLISEFTCDLLGTNRNVAEGTPHDFQSSVWKGEATSPWLTGALALEPWAVQLPEAIGLWGSPNYPRWRDHMEKPWDSVEREREMLSQTLAPTCLLSPLQPLPDHGHLWDPGQNYPSLPFPNFWSTETEEWFDTLQVPVQRPSNTTPDTVLKISGGREEDGNSRYYMLTFL